MATIHLGKSRRTKSERNDETVRDDKGATLEGHNHINALVRRVKVIPVGDMFPCNVGFNFEAAERRSASRLGEGDEEAYTIRPVPEFRTRETGSFVDVSWAEANISEL